MTWNAGSSQNFTIKKQKKYQSTGALIKFKNTEVKLNLNENEHSEVPKQYEYKKFNSKIRHLKNRSPPKNQRDRK